MVAYNCATSLNFGDWQGFFSFFSFGVLGATHRHGSRPNSTQDEPLLVVDLLFPASERKFIASDHEVNYLWNYLWCSP